MHLLDAWTSLPSADLVRLLGIPVAVLLALLLPGRRVSGAAALIIALACVRLTELAAPWPVRALWVLLWALVAWQAGGEGHERERPRPARRAGFEAGAVALPLGFTLLALLLAAVSRQSLEPLDARRASLGALTLGVGLLHLMMRRHVRRALVAFAAMGLGLELLTAAARAADVTHRGTPAGAALAATATLIVLARRIAGARERYAHSPSIADAHELVD